MILDFHNELRQKVASGAEIRGLNGSQPAGNITNLKWDEKAAEISQRWANQCLFSHDNCRNYGEYYQYKLRVILLCNYIPNK